MNTVVLLNGKGLLPLGQAKAAVSFWGTPKVVCGRQQNERQLPFRSPDGSDSASGRRTGTARPVKLRFAHPFGDLTGRADSSQFSAGLASESKRRQNTLTVEDSLQFAAGSSINFPDP
jgi:hypothetical protein